MGCGSTQRSSALKYYNTEQNDSLSPRRKYSVAADPDGQQLGLCGIQSELALVAFAPQDSNSRRTSFYYVSSQGTVLV